MIANSTKHNTLNIESDYIHAYPIEGWSESELKLIITQRIGAIEFAWDLVGAETLLSSSYLKAVESAPPEGMQFVYALLLDGENPVGRFYYQMLHFNAAKSLGISAKDRQECGPSFFKGLAQSFKDAIARNVDFFTLVNGNLLLTGPYGLEIGLDLSADRRWMLHRTVNRVIRNHISKVYPQRVPVFLIKEMYADHRIHQENLNEASLFEFCIQPNFLMDILPEWRALEDYLSSLRAKYRIRAKRAFKKLGSTLVKEMDTGAIQKHKKELHQLYQQVANQIGFNMVSLHEDYFYQLKLALDEKFRLEAFWDGAEIVGFFTYFFSGKSMVVHYVGFDAAQSQKQQLYLNMLFLIIERAIEEGVSTINFGRTAHEIKSSIGAIPEEMYCYISHKNKVIQPIIPKLLDYLSPSVEWEPRHPFKDQREDEPGM
jgi:hypothetical protein